MFNNFSENRVTYGVKWRNMVKPDRPQMTIQHGEHALFAG
jgi:hypothetical protein